MKLRAIDLFAGAGGTSTGLALAADELAAAMSFPTATIELAPGVKQASLFTGDMP